jgi:hypothetical protein
MGRASTAWFVWVDSLGRGARAPFLIVRVYRGGTRRAATSSAAFSGTPFPRSGNVTALVPPAERGRFRRSATKPTAKQILPDLQELAPATRHSSLLKNSKSRGSRGNEAHSSSKTKASSKPPHVGCYFFNGLIGQNLGKISIACLLGLW